jgi:hypothetical protein
MPSRKHETSLSPSDNSISLRLVQAAYSIPATRLVLNLRDSASKRNDITLGGQSPADIVLSDLSRVEFAPRRDPELGVFAPTSTTEQHEHAAT